MFPKPILTLSLLSLFTYSYGASTTELPLMNEQQRQLFEQLKGTDTNIPSSKYALPNEESEEINVTVTDGVVYPVREIVLHDNTLLSSGEVMAIINRYTHQDLGIRALTKLAKELTNLYIEHGYITSRVYLTPQDISDGVVDLYALEGSVEKVITDNSKTKLPFFGIANNALDLVKLENSLEQVNRLRSNKTTMNLIPGEGRGGSVVMLNTQETRPVFGNLGINNYGSDSTGKFQLSGGLTWENPLGISDIFTANINTTDKHQEGKKSFGNFYTYGVPLGSCLWEAGFSRFTYDQTIHGLNNDFISHGESVVASLTSTYKLHHTQEYSIDINAQIAKKSNESRIEGTLIESSTYDLSVGNLGLKYVYRQPSWELYTLLNYYQGMNIFNPTTGRTLPNDFSKYTLSVGATKYLAMPLPITYQFSGFVQHSTDLLYSVEQISIGGAYSIRGFQKQGITGNSGWYTRNDLNIPFNEYFSPYIAYDIGHISSDSSTEGGTLSSASVGLRTHYRAFSLDVYHANPLNHPNDTFSTEPFVGANLSANF
jgi:hemolysin activation/secretion protein